MIEEMIYEVGDRVTFAQISGKKILRHLKSTVKKPLFLIKKNPSIVTSIFESIFLFTSGTFTSDGFFKNIVVKA